MRTTKFHRTDQVNRTVYRVINNLFYEASNGVAALLIPGSRTGTARRTARAALNQSLKHDWPDALPIEWKKRADDCWINWMLVSAPVAIISFFLGFGICHLLILLGVRNAKPNIIGLSFMIVPWAYCFLASIALMFWANSVTRWYQTYSANTRDLDPLRSVSIDVVGRPNLRLQVSVQVIGCSVLLGASIPILLWGLGVSM